MLINCDLSRTIYVLGSSVQSEEIAGFVQQEHPNVQVVHHDNFDKISAGSQCMIGFTNIDYRIREIALLKNKMKWPSYVHPGAQLDPTTKIGMGCLIYPMATVLYRSVLDDFCTVFAQVHVSHVVKLGKNVVICPGTVIGGSTTIGDDVFIGQSCSIVDKISICSNVKIAMSSNVTKSIASSGNYVNSRKTNILL